MMPRPRLYSRRTDYSRAAGRGGSVVPMGPPEQLVKAQAPRALCCPLGCWSAVFPSCHCPGVDLWGPLSTQHLVTQPQDLHSPHGTPFLEPEPQPHHATPALLGNTSCSRSRCFISKWERKTYHFFYSEFFSDI